MDGTRSRFHHDRLASGKILDRKNSIRLDLQVLRKSAVQGDAITAHFFTKQIIAAHTVKAFATSHVTVTDHALTFFQTVGVGSQINNLPGKLVARNQRKTGAELALMDMQSGAADSAGMYLDQHLIAFHLGIGYVAVNKI